MQASVEYGPLPLVTVPYILYKCANIHVIQYNTYYNTYIFFLIEFFFRVTFYMMNNGHRLFNYRIKWKLHLKNKNSKHQEKLFWKLKLILKNSFPQTTCDIHSKTGILCNASLLE